MKTITRLGSIVAAFTLFSVLAPATLATERANKYFRVAGKVIKIDKKDRTLLVSDRTTHKLYLIEVPEAALFKITFGRYMRMGQPDLQDVRIGERVEIRCTRTDTDHLAQLDDGRQVATLTAAR